MTPGEAAFHVWYRYCTPDSHPEIAGYVWEHQMDEVQALWEQIAAAACANTHTAHTQTAGDHACP